MAGDDSFKSGRYQDAIDAYTACLAVDPSHKSFNAKLYNNRATAYSKLRKHQEVGSSGWQSRNGQLGGQATHL